MRHSVINFDVLRYVLAAAEIGKFGHAAMELGVEPSTLSRKIDQLEAELGLTIFERGHSGVRPTMAGKELLVQVRRLLADIEAIKASGRKSGACTVGEIRLGVRMPPVGEPIQSMLADWHRKNPRVGLKIYELNEREILIGIKERRLDAALMTKHTLWPQAAAEPLYRERMLVALPSRHRLARRKALSWSDLAEETFLVQGWDDSQTAREFFAGFLGSGVRYSTQAASKQTVLGLVAAGFGITLVTKGQATVKLPGVEFRAISNKNAWVGVELVWAPESEDAVVGRFVAFLRDRARTRNLV